MIFDHVTTFRKWSDWMAEHAPSARYEVEVNQVIVISALRFADDGDRVLYLIRWS